MEDKFMKDIHELTSPSLEVASIPLVFSLISQRSRVGAAERCCTRLMSMVNLIYLETLLPRRFWDYVAFTTSYILNHTPNSSGLKTPFEIWMGYKEIMEHLRVWDCKVYLHVSDKDMERCFFIRYPQGEKGYLLWKKSRDEIIICRIWHFLKDGREDREEEEVEAEWEGRETWEVLHNFISH